MKTTDKKNYSRLGIILLCSLVYFVSYFSRKDFAAAMAGMLSEEVLARSTAGLIGTMMFVFYGTGQLISGYLGDKIKPKYLIIIGLTTTGVCNFLMPIIPEWAMIVVWGVNGLAQAMLWPPIVKILSQHLDHKTYVTANLVVTSAAHLATILLYVYVPICLSFMSWQAVFFTASIIAICSVVIFAVVMRMILPESASEASELVGKTEQSDPVSKPEKGAKTTHATPSFAQNKSIIDIFRDSGVLTVFVCIIVCGFLRDGIESWLPTLYSEAFGKGASESILVSVILPIFSIASISLVTALHKNKLFGNEIIGSAILFGVALVCAIPLMIFVELDGGFFAVASLLLTALICAAMHGVNFLLISCLPGRFSATGRAATVGGVCNSCVYIGAAISTYGIAMLSEALGWRSTIASWIALCALGIAFCFVSYKKYTAMLNAEV